MAKRRPASGVSTDAVKLMRAEILLARASSTYENPGWSYRYYRSFSRASKKGKSTVFDTGGFQYPAKRWLLSVSSLSPGGGDCKGGAGREDLFDGLLSEKNRSGW